jgi:hypothetical protein
MAVLGTLGNGLVVEPAACCTKEAQNHGVSLGAYIAARSHASV